MQGQYLGRADPYDSLEHIVQKAELGEDKKVATSPPTLLLLPSTIDTVPAWMAKQTTMRQMHTRSNSRRPPASTRPHGINAVRMNHVNMAAEMR